MQRITERVADDTGDEMEVCSTPRDATCYLSYFKNDGTEVVFSCLSEDGVRKLRDVLNRVLGE